MKNKKEIVEQKIVADYILNIFNQHATDVIYNKKPFIKKTSNIDHLCTSISGVIRCESRSLGSAPQFNTIRVSPGSGMGLTEKL